MKQKMSIFKGFLNIGATFKCCQKCNEVKKFV